MDIKEYISSGILELFASGNLTIHESAEVENNIRNHPEIKEEYEKIQKTIYMISSANLKIPSKSVKESLFKNLKITAGSAPVTEKEAIKVNKKESRTYKYLLAASILFLILSLVLNYFLYSNLNKANNKISVLSDQKKIITQEYEAVNNKLSTAYSDIKIIQDKNYKVIDLKGLEISPSSEVMTYWDPVSCTVYIEVKSLPVPPPDKQYQLWGMVDGKPVDMGVMDVDPSDKSLHKMKSMEVVQAFAVTLEPKGGSANPTMEQMYVMGEV